jgi:hypothetical protein
MRRNCLEIAQANSYSNSSYLRKKYLPTGYIGCPTDAASSEIKNYYEKELGMSILITDSNVNTNFDKSTV